MWWPNDLLSCEPPSSDLLLFGWWLDAVNSIDVVVAHATLASEISLHFAQSDLQDFVLSINSKMPKPLQEASAFCMLGHCTAHQMDEDMKSMENNRCDPLLKSLPSHGLVESDSTKTISYQDVNATCNGNTSANNCGGRSCGCGILNRSFEPHREALTTSNNWIQLLSKSQGILCKGSKWIPEFHHMHQNGHIISNCDIHVSGYI